MRMRVVSVEMVGVEDAEVGSILATLFEGLLRGGDAQGIHHRGTEVAGPRGTEEGADAGAGGGADGDLRSEISELRGEDEAAEADRAAEPGADGDLRSEI